MEKESSAVLEENGEQENALVGPESEGNYFLDESSDEDDFMSSSQKQQSDGQTARVELDATPLCNGSIIYDSDLANMVDRPWTKPGANVTDYFNYGSMKILGISIVRDKKSFEQNLVTKVLSTELFLMR
uniref:Pre-mRNA 3'-end-processing factor FIP1 n=1 Tax=Ditylenchus dipsaci TaxID=166011 RepID=A0A915DCV7_9BILA